MINSKITIEGLDELEKEAHKAAEKQIAEELAKRSKDGKQRTKNADTSNNHCGIQPINSDISPINSDLKKLNEI